MTLAAVLIALALLAVALLYSSVGFGGGTGYLAIIALAGLGHDEIRAAALALNVIVAGIGTIQFARRGHFNWRLLRVFLVTSVPTAFLAGLWMRLDEGLYHIVLGLILIYAAYRLWPVRAELESGVERPPLLLALLSGAVIGLISGLVGVGGGVFLAPMLLLSGWATPRQTAGITAPFILFNSLAAIIGLLFSDHGMQVEPGSLGLWIACVAVGGWIGSTSGAALLPPNVLRILLCAVLVIAAARLIFS